ncbi:hypothetical protein GCM10023226_29190 [Nocardioides nanhaiensis]|uniref:HTH tetR-type domain-containing protein n=1 Tax=Nocardioides nanhaiensis TaxID=1476871 RepID=A0ABP8WGV0_9ACTN
MGAGVTPASSGRPDEAERDGLGTRDRILVAAATMLGEDPTARLSVRGVAARAGVSVGSLRHFFPTQRQLLDTVVAGLAALELPDDPLADRSRSASDRLLTALQLVLAEVGAGEQARRHVSSLHAAYVASPPGEDAEHAFHALERLSLGRIEGWLAGLREEGVALREGVDDVETAARFLLTVLNGLALERALPGAPARVAGEEVALRIAVEAVLATG